MRVAATLVGLGALGAALPSCTAVAAGGLGIMLSQEFQQGAQVLHCDHGSEFVWMRVKETLAHLSTRQPQFDEDELRAFATVDGGSIQVMVSPGEPGECKMAVKARRYGLQNAALAESVLDRIREEIDG